MASPAPSDNLRQSAGLFAILGIVTLLLGLVSMGAPLLTGLVVTVIIGTLLIVNGLAQVFHGFRVLGTGARIFAIAVGVLSVAAGAVVIARPVMALATLTLILAAYFLVDGLLTVVAALRARDHRGWGWLLCSGIISLLLGVLIWRQWPVSGVWALGVLIGIRIIMSGLGMILVGSATRSHLARGQQEGGESTPG